MGVLHTQHHKCFNPLPHAEGDLILLSPLKLPLCFNPLPHAEGDLLPKPPNHNYCRFNPLPHAEGDVHAGRSYADNRVSIHSLTQRETVSEWLCKCFQIVFQSTPSRRGRRGTVCESSNSRSGFNPLPHAEGDAVM